MSAQRDDDWFEPAAQALEAYESLLVISGQGRLFMYDELFSPVPVPNDLDGYGYEFTRTVTIPRTSKRATAWLRVVNIGHGAALDLDTRLDWQGPDGRHRSEASYSICDQTAGLSSRPFVNLTADDEARLTEQAFIDLRERVRCDASPLAAEWRQLAPGSPIVEDNDPLAAFRNASFLHNSGSAGHHRRVIRAVRARHPVPFALLSDTNVGTGAVIDLAALRTWMVAQPELIPITD